MSMARELRRPSNLVGLGSLLAVCTAAMFNLWFIDTLGDT